jgi:hypothetical protein
MFDYRYEEPVESGDLVDALWNARVLADGHPAVASAMRMRSGALLEQDLCRAGTSLRRMSVVPLLEGHRGSAPLTLAA